MKKTPQPRPRQARATGKKPAFVPLAHELPMIAAMAGRSVPAARRAEVLHELRQYIAKHGLLPDSHGNYFDAISRIATIIDSQNIAKADAALDRWDDIIDKTTPRPSSEELPSAIACNRWTPELQAALIMGIGLGTALALNGGAR